MKEKIFIDTGFWIALFDKKDEHHHVVKNNIKFILKSYSICCSDFILFETITYLNCFIKNHVLALKFLNKIESINSITIFDVDSYIKNKALSIFKKYSDHFFSFTDCTSFALMQKKVITKYAGFDKHFQKMGFTPIIK